MASEGMASDEWDEDTLIEVRKFAFEHALMAHLHKRDAATDLALVFKDSDRIVNYVLGDLNP